MLVGAQVGHDPLTLEIFASVLSARSASVYPRF